MTPQDLSAIGLESHLPVSNLMKSSTAGSILLSYIINKWSLITFNMNNRFLFHMKHESYSFYWEISSLMQT